MTTLSKLKFILNQQKKNVDLKAPFFLKKMLLPLVRLKMELQITRDFHNYQINRHLGNNDLTIESCLAFGCYLFKIKPFFQKHYSSMFRQIVSPDFVKVVTLFGDIFSSTLIQELMSNTINERDASLASEQIQKLSRFYLSSEIQGLYERILVKQLLQEDAIENRKKVNRYFASIFINIYSNKSLCNGYLVFFDKVVEEEPQKIMNVFYALQSISHNIGTIGAYESFLKFCNKYREHAGFNELLKLAATLTTYEQPELFQQTFSWAVTSGLSPDVIESAFTKGLLLLEDPKETANASYYFSSYLKYLREREDSLKKMETQAINYYIEKAVTFFLE